MKQQKTELRKLIKERKSTTPATTLKTLSVSILETLEQHPVFQAATTVLLYHSLSDEVYTHDFIAKWSNAKRIVLPVVIGDELELRLYASPHDLSMGSYGILEPTGASFSDYSTIDLAIIPGIAFDHSGTRLGRGKGYYDKLLPKLTAYKIGICFPFQCVDKVPSEAFDVKMDEIVC